MLHELGVVRGSLGGGECLRAICMRSTSDKATSQFLMALFVTEASIAPDSAACVFNQVVSSRDLRLWIIHRDV